MMNIKTVKRSVAFVIAIALGLLLPLTAFAAGLGESLQQSAGDAPVASDTKNGVTIEIKHVVSDTYSIFVIYQITVPEGKALRDKVIWEQETLSVVNQESNSNGWYRVLEQTSNKRTVLYAHTQTEPITGTKANFYFKNLATLEGIVFVPFIAGEWDMTWDIRPVQSRTADNLNLTTTINNSQMTVKQVTVSPAAVYLQLEGPGQPSQIAPVVTLTDGKTVAYDKTTSEIVRGETDYSDRANPRQHIFSACYFDSLIDIQKVASVTVGNVTIPMNGQSQQTAQEPSAWAAEQVKAAIGAGIVPSQLQGKYTQAITRAEFCALAAALYETVMGKEITERVKFSDTSDVNVEKMAALEVVNGVGEGIFAPDSLLTREQAATMLARLADVMGKPLSAQTAAFSDTQSISTWAIKAVGQVQAAGVMDGVGNNTFSPAGDYTREQSIITMMRLFELAV